MIFRQIVRPQTGCASYVAGCGGKGFCAVIDPLPDFIDDYLEISERTGMRITHVLDTHVHADHLSGARRLAELTGADYCLYENAGARYNFTPVGDGREIELGNVKLTILHTPGHTPESMTVLVTDRTRAREPWFALTGDTLFVGDAGRPDLVSEEGVRDLYRSLGRLTQLPDGLEIYPAHFSGSVCGRKLSGKPMSTLGFEKRYNAALQPRSEEEFVRFMLTDVPPKPEDFVAIRRTNLGLEEPRTACC